MDAIFSYLSTAGDLLLVILGFSLIVFLHELGHFVAARWAGIRVLAFAMGFGPAFLSYRKGFGWRRGSSDREYRELMHAAASGATTLEGARTTYHLVSPTEYRVNMLPFGGYVRMLGQDDLDPSAVSSAPDSYQSVAVWKRMIVISAGVIMNIVSAACMFILVFMIGLRTEPPTIGDVLPGSPAAKAVALNASSAHVISPGLAAGDVVTSVNGRTPNSFNDLVLATAMAGRGDAINLTVQRHGVATPLEFQVVPRQSTITKLLDIGIGPAVSTVTPPARNASEAAETSLALERLGLKGLGPDMKLVRIDSQTQIAAGHELDDAIRRSEGKSLELEFESRDGSRAVINVPTRAELQSDLIPRGDDTVVPQHHVMGLTPVMTVREAQPPAKSQGLRDGDIFARIGSVEYPSVSLGMQEIKRSRSKRIPVVVLRKNDTGGLDEVSLEVAVTTAGTIGFFAGETDADESLLALPPDVLRPAVDDSAATPPTFSPPAAGRITRAGSRILAINGNPVSTLSQARDMLRRIAVSALAETQHSATARLTIEPPRLAGSPGTPRPPQEIDLPLAESDLRALESLSWTSSIGSWIFRPEETLLQAKSPLAAMELGLDETRRVMITTYLTFARLFEGTVKVEHLKGPVGIAHIGTRLADRGMVWLLFFMALISVNLAVVNFLPLPIVDGGQFIFLVLEQVRGKPVPVAIQNAVTLAGLLMIGSVFLLVTFNDIRNLLGM